MTAATAPYAIEMGLLHMLLFWTLILFDSYAYSYKKRGCRMCNSPFLFRGQGQLMLANRSMAVVKFWTASSALPSSMPSWTQRRICSSRTT